MCVEMTGDATPYLNVSNLCHSSPSSSTDPYMRNPTTPSPFAQVHDHLYPPLPYHVYILCAVARRRSGQRWSALVSAHTSRIAKTMRPVRGVSHWQTFLAHITKHYKPTFLAAFNPPSHVLSCVGKCNGEPCSHGFEVDFCSPAAATKLEHLHVDHEQDVLVTCDMWQRCPRIWLRGRRHRQCAALPSSLWNRLSPNPRPTNAILSPWPVEIWVWHRRWLLVTATS